MGVPPVSRDYISGHVRESVFNFPPPFKRVRRTRRCSSGPGLSLPTSRALGHRPRAHASTRSVFDAVPAEPDMPSTHDDPIILGSDWNFVSAQEDKATRCSRRLAGKRDKSSAEAADAQLKRPTPPDGRSRAKASYSRLVMSLNFLLQK